MKYLFKDKCFGFVVNDVLYNVIFNPVKELDNSFKDLKLGLELDCLCRENNLLSGNLILVSAFGVIHLGSYSLIIEQSGINSEFEFK